MAMKSTLVQVSRVPTLGGVFCWFGFWYQEVEPRALCTRPLGCITLPVCVHVCASVCARVRVLCACVCACVYVVHVCMLCACARVNTCTVYLCMCKYICMCTFLCGTPHQLPALSSGAVHLVF